jgi:hypothetical protein
LSDISLNWSPFDMLLIALLLGSPGAAIGALCGALGWRAHRIWGAALGALIGWLICLGAFIAWAESDLSLNLGFSDAAVLALRRGLPGLLVGAAAGAALWRSRRVFGALCGAFAGIAIWLGGRLAFTGAL